MPQSAEGPFQAPIPTSIHLSANPIPPEIKQDPSPIAACWYRVHSHIGTLHQRSSNCALIQRSTALFACSISDATDNADRRMYRWRHNSNTPRAGSWQTYLNCNLTPGTSASSGSNSCACRVGSLFPCVGSGKRGFRGRHNCGNHP